MLSLDEFLRLRQEVIKTKSGITDTAEMEVEDDATPTESSEIPPGSEAPPGDEVPPGEDADAEAKKMMEVEIPELSLFEVIKILVN